MNTLSSLGKLKCSFHSDLTNHDSTGIGAEIIDVLNVAYFERPGDEAFSSALSVMTSLRDLGFRWDLNTAPSIQTSLVNIINAGVMQSLGRKSSHMRLSNFKFPELLIAIRDTGIVLPPVELNMLINCASAYLNDVMDRFTASKIASTLETDASRSFVGHLKVIVENSARAFDSSVSKELEMRDTCHYLHDILTDASSFRRSLTRYSSVVLSSDKRFV
jgi:hypothetical protein